MTVDCSSLLSDIAERLSAGETFAEMMSDLHYAVLAEIEEYLDGVLSLIQVTFEEVSVNNSQEMRPNNNPEPMLLLPPRLEGVFNFLWYIAVCLKTI